MAASASAGASGVDFNEISSIKRFGSDDAALEVNKRKILHVNVEDVNALNHDELQEKEMFEQSECFWFGLVPVTFYVLTACWLVAAWSQVVQRRSRSSLRCIVWTAMSTGI